MKRYLVLHGVFEAGRMFCGATSAAYLVSIGQPIYIIAELKFLQAIFMLLADFPTGIIADIYGRRLCLILSALSGGVAFITYSIGSKFGHFALAELCIALCLSFWSGAYEAYVIEKMDIGGNRMKLNRFFHLNGAVNSTLVIVSGFIGGLLGSLNLRYPFWVSAGTLATLTVWLILRFPGDVMDESHKHDSTKKSVFRFIRELKYSGIDRALYPFVAGMVLMQFLVQPVIYYWQPWFQNLPGGSSPAKLGIVFSAFQVVIVLTGIAFANLSKRGLTANVWLFASCWAGFSVSMLCMLRAESFIVSLLLFCMAEAHLTAGVSCLKATMNEKIESRYRASVLSAVSMFGRMGALASLGMMKYLLSTSGSISKGLHMVFAGSGVVGILICISIPSVRWLLSIRSKLSEVSVECSNIKSIPELA